MARTHVAVNNSAIASLFSASSEIGVLTMRIARSALAKAELTAPKRTGRLAASMHHYSNQHYTYGGPYARQLGIISNLDYALFVERGTTSPIVAKHLTAKGNQGWMIVPRSRMSFYTTLRKTVNGQRANPFMRRAMESACGVAGLPIYLP